MVNNMKPGFFTIISAQFFSSLADNALLIAAIAVLIEIAAPEWMRPLLKLFFTISYVLLAPFVGPFSDSMPKGRVMFLTNNIKIVGCLLFFFNIHPLAAYAIVGFGAASYAPAKYGILTELLPPEKLVLANGWLESTTVVSILLGTLLGGLLITDTVSSKILSLNLIKFFNISTPAESSIFIISMIYFFAAILNLFIPKTGAKYKQSSLNPLSLIKKFINCNIILWKDKVGQISLAVTTLFWGAGATLQFIVLQWAEINLNMDLDQAAMLQGIVSVGIIIGSFLAAKYVSLFNALKVLPLGAFLGLVIPLMTLSFDLGSASFLLILIGALGGFFVVPMNALLQHRGYVTLSAGQSIAVQNFNENLNVLFMLGLYSILLFFRVNVNTIVFAFGAFLGLTMLMVIIKYQRNKLKYDLNKLIGDKRSALLQDKC